MKQESLIAIAKQLHDRRILDPFGGFFILFVLLGFQPFCQITVSITVQFGLIAVFAEHAGNVVLVGMIIRDGPPLTDRWQQRCKNEDVQNRIFHVAAKIKPIWRLPLLVDENHGFLLVITNFLHLYAFKVATLLYFSLGMAYRPSLHLLM